MNEIFLAQNTWATVVVASFVLVVIFRRHHRLARFWSGMAKQWRASMILSAIYLSSAIISQPTGLEPSRIPLFILGSGSYIFSLTMLGLGFASGIENFEPLQLRKGMTFQELILWALITMALIGFIAVPIGKCLTSIGITGPIETASAMEFMRGTSLFRAFLMLLAGAGIAEEVLFRLFVMSGLLILLRRDSWAIFGSAVIFGLYHLSPLDSLYLEFWHYPLYQFLITFLSGLILAWVYRKKGLEVVILGHTLGDFAGVTMMQMGL